MQYRFKSTVPGIRRGTVTELDPTASQTQERLARGIIEPFNPVQETRQADPVEESKARRSRKKKADAE